MATFHFELVSPDKIVFSGEVDQVDVPGAEGDFGVFAGHVPLVATMRPGILTVYAGGTTRRIAVFGGFAEVSPEGLSVLADVASGVEDIDMTALAAHIESLEAKVKTMTAGDVLDRELERLDHFHEMQRHLTGTAMH
jgi:F-type H+-transporting ATPase subunit epsilon